MAKAPQVIGYLPDERPPLWKLLLYAIQQVIVMFPATVANHHRLPCFHNHLRKRSCNSLFHPGDRKKNSIVLWFKLFLYRCDR